MIEGNANGHRSTGKRCQYKQRRNQREPGDATRRGDELHVPPAHAPGEVKHQKDQAAKQSSGGCRSQLPPSAKAEMQQQPKQDCRKCKSIRYPAANYVIHRSNESAQKGASRVRKLDIQFPHEMLSGPQFRFDLQSCKFHIGLDPEG